MTTTYLGFRPLAEPDNGPRHFSPSSIDQSVRGILVHSNRMRGCFEGLQRLRKLALLHHERGLWSVGPQ
jgi:hypothetical protein